MKNEKTINLPVFDITITLSDGGGIISHPDPQNEAEDGVYSLVLAHACAGIDVESPAYLEGIEVSLEAAWNQTEDHPNQETDLTEAAFDNALDDATHIVAHIFNKLGAALSVADTEELNDLLERFVRKQMEI